MAPSLPVGDELSVAGEIFARSLDPATTVERIARLATRDLADWCVVYLAADTGDISRYEVACRDPDLDPLARELRAGRLDRTTPCPVWRVLDSGVPEISPHALPASFVFTHPEGGPSTLELPASSYMVFPMDAGNGPSGAMAFVSTGPERAPDPERMRVAGELARRTALSVDNARLLQAARSATRKRDQILRMVSHDLSAPLESIIASVERLAERWKAGVAAPADGALLEGVRLSARQMLRLVRDLLDGHEIEAGRFRVELQPTSLLPVVKAAVAEFQGAAEAAGVGIAVAAPEVTPRVLGDPDRLVQLLSNLLSNAIRHSSAGDEVTLSIESEAEVVHVKVADTGSGMAPAEVTRYLDGPPVPDAPYRGRVGLGLTIAKQIAEAHGGRLTVDTEPGRGSVFDFTLPVAPGV